MSICIEKLPHKTDKCNSSDGLQVFASESDNQVTGFCFSCGTYIPDPYGDSRTSDQLELPRERTEEEIKETLAEISGFPTVTVVKRKLREATLKQFGVKTSLSEYDGKTPTVMYFPMTVGGKHTGYYAKSLPKDGKSMTWAVGNVKGADPFNWVNARNSGAYKIIITEGLADACAVEAIFKLHGTNNDYHPAVISLPNGVNSVKSLAKISADLRKFKQVVLCFDDDEHGREATRQALVILPQATSVTLPYKDANDCILNGKSKAAYNALSYSTERPKNTRLINASDLHTIAREPTPYGELTWPFPTMNRLLRNIRYGETIYIGAGVKMGKSELLNSIAGHLIKEHGIKVFMAKPEEVNKKTYKLMCNKMVGKVFHDPAVEFDYKAYDIAGEMIKDKLILVDLYQHLGWESLKADIIEAANMGCKAVFIDPITNLTNGVNSAEANTMLGEIAQSLAALSIDLDIVIFLFCHLKAHEGLMSRDARQKKYENDEYIGIGNTQHEFGGSVMSSQFAGSRSMMRSCNLMIGLEGNKDPELPDNIRNTRVLTILEDREFGNSARIPISWDRNTTMFMET